MGEPKILDVESLCGLLNKSEHWFYRNSDKFDYAKVCLGGKPIRPFRFHYERVLELLGAGCSLTTEQNRKKPQSLSRKDKRRERLWG